MQRTAQSCFSADPCCLCAKRDIPDVHPLRCYDLAWKRISMTHEERIVRSPQVCGGDPVFRGTRVTLRTVLASLAAGDSVHEILADFPVLKAEDVQAAIEFAAASAGEDLPVPSTPQIGPQAPQSR